MHSACTVKGMAIRFKSGSAPKSRDALLWIIVSVLMIWGAWQAIKVRKQVLHALHPRHAATAPAATEPTTDENLAQPPPSPDISDTGRMTQSLTPDLAPAAAPEVIHVLSPGLLVHTRRQVSRARQDLRHGRLLKARRTLQAALRPISGFGEKQAAAIRSLLMEINRHSILGSAIVPGDTLVKLITVQGGDSLDYLAGLYRITPEMILRLNPGLQARSMLAGTGVKVILGPMDAHLILHASRIDVMIRRHFIADYPFHLVAPIEPAAGRYRVVNYLPGPLGLDEWILQSETGRSRLILAGGDIPDADITLSPGAISSLHRMINPDFSRFEVEP